MRAGLAVPRWLLWAWNIWGCWCLAVIAVIAVTTSPLVRLFGDDPRNINTWVLYFPYVWLPVVLVTVAIAGHVMVTRALRRAHIAR
jgi:Na+-driven multidrug efflux pump